MRSRCSGGGKAHDGGGTESEDCQWVRAVHTSVNKKGEHGRQGRLGIQGTVADRNCQQQHNLYNLKATDCSSEC